MHVPAHRPKNENARKREKREQGRVAKNGALFLIQETAMSEIYTDSRNGTRPKKREREETGKTGRAAVLQKAGRAPWKTGENHVRGVDGCTYGHTGQKTRR